MNAPLSPNDLGIDVMIHPELIAAKEIAHLLKRSAASDVINLAENRMQLVGIRLDKHSPLLGITLIEYAQMYSQAFFVLLQLVDVDIHLFLVDPLKCKHMTKSLF